MRETSNDRRFQSTGTDFDALAEGSFANIPPEELPASAPKNWVWTPPLTEPEPFAYMPSALILTFLAAGAILDNFVFNWSWRVWLNVGLLTMLLWFSSTFLNQKRRQTLGSILVFVILASVGGLWHNCIWNVYYRVDMFSRCSQKPCSCVIRGTILDPPRRTRSPQGFSPIPEYDKTVFTVRANSVRSRQTWTPADGKVRVSVTGHLPGFEVGDEIELVGSCSLPNNDSTGRFNYRDFLRSRRILTVMTVRSPDGASQRTQERRASFQVWIGSCQRKAQESLEKRFSITREARLASAFLLGNRNDLPEGVVEQFQETGTIHVLVVSGLHVGILTTLLHFALGFAPLSRNVRYIIVCVMIMFYIALTGAQPPAIRAGVLCLTATIALAFNQRPLSFNVLALSGIIVLILNPSSVFQTGTQLSFLTVGAIIAMEPTAEKIASYIFPVGNEKAVGIKQRHQGRTRKSVHGIFVTLILSFMLLGVIAPLIATRFHVLSLFSVLLNLVLSVPIFISIMTGMIAMLLSPFDSFFLFDFIANVSAKICQSSLWTMDYIVQTVHSWRWSRFWVTGLNEPLLIAFYVILFAWAFSRWCRARSMIMASAIAIWLATISFIPIYASLTRPEQMNVEFINVEHGLCTLIRLPDGKNLLYDAGKMTSPERGVESVCDYLWKQGITKIHGVILSHSDADHYNMLPTLSERFAIDTIYVSEMMFDDTDNETLEKFKYYLKKANVKAHIVYRGDRLGNSKQYKIEFLHPGPGGVLDLLSPENANSLVVELEYAGRHFLLTGDLVGNGVREISMEESPGYDVVQAPHHGSHLSLTPEFIRWTKAAYAVFSESQTYAQKQGRAMFEQASVRVFHTGQDGSARFAVFPDGELTYCIGE
ncbi:MAG: ComEC/Rec2 family competence protein [Thermoguttaceae bacterium]|nr:ComEC/Rec2 family competence protein [Thermoguttaceae bacterium]